MCIFEAIWRSGYSATTKKILGHCLTYSGVEELYLEERVHTALNSGKSYFVYRDKDSVWTLNKDSFFFVEDLSGKHQKKAKRSYSIQNEDPDYLGTSQQKKKFCDIPNLTNISEEELIERIKESKLTSLQILISISILKTVGLESKLDDILNFVCENQGCLIGKDGIPKSTDPKRAILASLSKNASTNPLFVKGEEDNTWKIGPNNVLYGFTTVPNGLVDYLSQAKTLNENYELTELQKMIMVSIALEKGPCPLRKIYEFVKPKYTKLKRRDGSSYASNAKRAIQASLSNNSSNRPIFQMAEGPDDNDTYWTLTERGQEQLDTLKTGEPNKYNIFDE